MIQKIQLALAVIILCTGVSYSQPVVKRKKYFSNGIKYIYEINKSTKLKEGLFICKHNRKKIFEGSYKNNMKTGKWHYYYKEELLLTIQYESDSIVNCKKTELLNKYGITTEKKMLDYLTASISKKLVYPMSAAMKNQSGTVLMHMEFNEAGKLVNYKMMKSSGSKHIDYSANELLKKYHTLPYIKRCVPSPITLCVPIVYRFSTESERLDYVNKYVNKTVNKWNSRFSR